jgi:hypothetical protein
MWNDTTAAGCAQTLCVQTKRARGRVRLHNARALYMLFRLSPAHCAVDVFRTRLKYAVSAAAAAAAGRVKKRHY